MKTFLVYNTSFFGDLILSNPLCRQLKRVYPDCRLIFVSDNTYADVARYMDGVDELWVYDKRNKHKGLSGFRKFYNEHKNKYSFDAAFIIYGNERGIMLAKWLGAKKVYADSIHSYVHWFLDNPPINYGKWVHVQDKHTYLAELYSNVPTESIKMKYNVPQEALRTVDTTLLQGIDKPLIAINPVTKNKAKDLKVDLVVSLIEKVVQAGMTPTLIGAGQGGVDYYESLPATSQQKIINFVNKTTLPELGALLIRCKALISADTGTAHFALALSVPVVDIFYLNNEENLRTWAPKDFYPHKLIAGDDYSAEYIWKETQELLNN